MPIRRLSIGLCLGALGALCFSTWLAAAAGNSPVADAAERGDRAAVQALLQQAADVNAAQADGSTALHWAALDGDVEMTRMLLYAGANVNASSRLGGYRPLHLAARNGRAAVVQVLLDAGAGPNVTDAHGTTPLMLAAASGSTETVSALLARGANVNATESVRGETALMFAAAFGRTEVVRALLAHGADWKTTTRVLDWTKVPKDDPRLIAFGRPQAGADKKDLEKVKKAAERAGPGQDAGKVPAAEAEAKGAAAAAAPGEDEDEQAAAEPANEPVPGAGIPGEKVVESAAKRARPGPDAKKAGFTVVRPKSYIQIVGTQGGLTALMFAARQGYLDTVQTLVAAGADVNQVDPGDKTSPLMIAIINGRFDAAMYLLDRGADPRLAQANGAAPLYAVLNCVWAPKTAYPQPQAYKQQKTTYLALMQALIARGADVNARLKEKVWYTAYNFDQSGVDESGATPFWLAAYGDDVDAMKLLVAHGADPGTATIKQAGRLPNGTGSYISQTYTDKSGLPPIPIGGPAVPPLLAASGQAYGSSFTANHHRYAPTGMLAAVKYLVEDLHADVNARDADGNTALHNAAARGDNAMILYLISKGADVHAVNRKGQSVADMANGPFQRTQPFPETIALLEKMGAKIMNKCVSC